MPQVIYFMVFSNVQCSMGVKVILIDILDWTTPYLEGEGQVSELCTSENSHKKRDINNKLATCNLSHTNIGLTLIIMNLKNREIVIQYSYRQ